MFIELTLKASGQKYYQNIFALDCFGQNRFDETYIETKVRNSSMNSSLIVLETPEQIREKIKLAIDETFYAFHSFNI